MSGCYFLLPKMAEHLYALSMSKDKGLTPIGATNYRRNHQQSGACKNDRRRHGCATGRTGIARNMLLQRMTVPARPFLKWVGGKRSILPELLRRIPDHFENYHEPFLGGGALFLALQPQHACLSDVNVLLVLTFKTVRDDVENLIRRLRVHERLHSSKYYITARNRLATEKDPAKLAALFIYLNKTCFNGLYRVNKASLFNVPMGNRKHPCIADRENLRSCSKALQQANIRQRSFEQEDIRDSDFYYLDPPYHEKYNGYDAKGFGEREHRRLARFCRKIDERGGYFMLSNSDTPFVRALYQGYNIEVISASRRVWCKAHQRGRETELIIRNYGYKRNRDALRAGRAKTGRRLCMKQPRCSQIRACLAWNKQRTRCNLGR